ncbi:MAG: ATP-dependent helicase HrpB [Planctomycetaceae bacterium]|nr:ATP-dependent helicase HrpB [Planctomycetaceae bacterium]
MQTLPIDSLLPTLKTTLRDHGSLVLKAPAGAGKTTRVPPAVLDIVPAGKVLVLEPRRIAARTAARRMAYERGERVGQTVGYRVRFDEQVSRDTRILVVTEGILLRMLQQDPFLEGIGAIIFDEFHERRLDSDLALAMTRRVRQTVRDDLRLIVMSATLDPAPIAVYLDEGPTLTSEGRQFPVDIRYAGRAARDVRLPEQVVAALPDMLQRSSGDVLVFLPGVGEIRQTERLLGEQRLGDVRLFCLYGDLPVEQQDEVLAPCSQRKVILATNVAETSITIDGVTGVIDTGLARSMQFDPEVGLDRLELGPISKASADQRAGRAGRTEPGVCLRLWDEVSQRHRPDYETAEVRRVDLSGPVLQLKAWGEPDVRQFPWYEAPDDAALGHAEQLLQRLGALSSSPSGEGATALQITSLGRQLVQLPLQPRLARLIVAGHQFGVGEEVTLLAALLSERDPFDRHQRRDAGRAFAQSQQVRRTHSDVLDRLNALQEFLQQGRRDFPFGSINMGAARNIARVAQQLQAIVRGAFREATAVSRPGDIDTALSRALLAAYPDRLARRREPGSQRGLMVGGRGVKLGPQSAVDQAELFLCIDLDGAGSEALVRQASAIDRGWLPNEFLSEGDALFFHPTQKQVVARSRVTWDDLVLEESSAEIRDPDAASRLLYAAAVNAWDQFFPRDDVQINALRSRLACLHDWMPELELPVLDQTQLDALLADVCQGCRSFAELRKLDWYSLLRGRLSYQQQQRLDREAPEKIAVPSGSHIALTYEQGRPPVLAVRIQEVFGMQATPRIAGGRVAVLMHLLAPNMRPQQVTDDLASFWANTYVEVRKELRRRYPKHAWPDDPAQARPERRPGQHRKS